MSDVTNELSPKRLMESTFLAPGNSPTFQVEHHLQEGDHQPLRKTSRKLLAILLVNILFLEQHTTNLSLLSVRNICRHFKNVFF